LLTQQKFRLLEIVASVASLFAWIFILLYQAFGVVIYLLSSLVLIYHYIRYAPLVLLNQSPAEKMYKMAYVKQTGAKVFMYQVLTLILLIFIISIGFQLAGFFPFFLSQFFYLDGLLLLFFMAIGMAGFKNVLIRSIWINGFISMLILIMPYTLCYVLVRYSGWFGP
jgi:hypothetical protein